MSINIRGLIAAGVIAGAAPVVAAAQCEPFPESPLVGTFTHAAVDGYVKTQFNGDWAPFLDRLERHLQGLRGTRDQGKTATIERKGQSMELTGARLAGYIAFAEQRLVVAGCLAEEAQIDALADFATAADGDDPAQSSVPAGTGERKVAALSTEAVANPLKFSIDATCRNGNAIFSFINRGQEWPEAGKFSVYRTEDDSLLKQRRMRVNRGQRISFRVRRAAESGLELGMWVQPEWYERAFAYDVRIKCRQN